MTLRLKSVYRFSGLRNLLDVIDAKSRVCTFCQLAHISNEPYQIRHLEVIKNITGASEEQVLKQLKKNIDIQMLSEEEVRNGLLKLKKLGIMERSKVDVLRLLKLHNITVQNRTMVLQEAGFIPSAITVGAILKYLSLSKMKLAELKKKNYIHHDTDVWQHMLTFLDEPLSNLEHKQASDDATLVGIKKNIVKQYLHYRIDLPIEQFEASRIFQRVYHKSLRFLCENIRIAESILQIPVSRIRNNLFLLVLNPENTMEILNKLQEVGGVDFRLAINAHPKILSSTCETLMQIKQHLKDYKIPDESVQKCFEVFTLNSDTVLNRLRELDRNEFFAACRQHPRVLELIMYQRKAIRRLQLLKDNKIHNTTLNLIASPEKAFERFYEVGGSDKPKGSDILHFLNSEFGADKNVLRTTLKRHPYWVFVPLVQIGKNLTTLREMGFTDDLILKDVHILLYPTEKIISEIESLSRGQKSGYDSCKGSDGLIRKELILQLVIYNIEKTCNFTGQAVWTSGPIADGSLQEQASSESS